VSDSGKLNNLPGDRGRGPAGEERELKIRASLSWRPCYPGSPVQQSLGAAPRDTAGPETSAFPVRPRFDVRMADNRTISHLEADLGAVQDAPRADPDAQRHDARPARRQDEMRSVR